MAVQLLLAANSAERASFLLSPLWETVASLHVLSDPRHHAVHLPWVLRTRKSMSAELRRRLRLWEFCWIGAMCDLFTPSDGDFATEMRGLAQVPIDVVAADLRRALVANIGLDSTATPADLIAAATARDAELGRIAQALHLNPSAVRDELLATLTTYWEQVFRARWERLEPVLAEDAAKRAALLEQGGLYPVLRSFEPRWNLDQAKGIVSIRSHSELTLDLRSALDLLLVPSYYAWPHTWISAHRQPFLAYAASAAQDAARVPLPPTELEQLLVALGSHTRLKIVELLRQRPHSTQELAYILRMAEGAVSRHLKVLTSAGLLTSKREGYYVLYGLRHARLKRAAHQMERLATR